MKWYWVYILSGVLWMGCKSDQEVQAPVEEVVVEKEKQTHEIFMVTVDNLRMRTAPGLDSEVVDKLREGSVVKGKGEYSDKIDTIRLRGVEYREPYYHVTTWNDKSTGWIYGGGMMKIYSSDTPNPFIRLEDFVSDINQVKLNDYRAGGEILSLISNYKGSVPEWNDLVYTIGSQFMEKVPPGPALIREIENYPWEDDDFTAVFAGNMDMEKYEITRRLESNGFHLYAAEGDMYPEIDNSILLKLIGGPFTEELSSYKSLMIDQENRFYEDAAIIVPMEKIVDHIIAQEIFISQYPDSPLISPIKEDMQNHMAILQYGMDNAPVRDYETKELTPEFKNAYNYIIKNYPSSDLAAAVDGWMG